MPPKARRARAQCPGDHHMSAPAPSTGNAADDTSGAANRAALGGSTVPTTGVDVPADPTVSGQPVPAPRAKAGAVDDSESAEDVHQEVAAFALGVLDDQQSIQFAAHLAACTRCADELDGLLATRDALASIDADHLATAEQILGDGHLWGQIVERAPELTGPPSYLPRVAFVTAVIVSAVLAIAGLVAVIVVLG